MKTSNYLAKLPQEATIKSIQVLKDYDLISLDVPTASQRLCPHCGSNDCVIKDSALRLFLVFLLQSPVFFIVSPAYLEELLTFLVSLISITRFSSSFTSYF